MSSRRVHAEVPLSDKDPHEARPRQRQHNGITLQHARSGATQPAYDDLRTVAMTARWRRATPASDCAKPRRRAAVSHKGSKSASMSLRAWSSVRTPFVSSMTLQARKVDVSSSPPHCSACSRYVRATLPTHAFCVVVQHAHHLLCELLWYLPPHVTVLA